MLTPTIIVGSAPAATAARDADLTGFRKIAINHAWRLRLDFDLCIYPADFPERERPTLHFTQASADDYLPAIHRAGGLIMCGATMAFAAGYYAVDAFPGSTLVFLGCDMIYEGERTHFYGRGDPDPLRSHISLRSLEAKSARLFGWGLLHDSLLLNWSTLPRSRLVFPRVSAPDQPAPPGKMSAFRQRAIDNFRKEEIILADRPPSIEVVDEIDALWVSSIELIEQVT